MPCRASSKAFWACVWLAASGLAATTRLQCVVANFGDLADHSSIHHSSAEPGCCWVDTGRDRDRGNQKFRQPRFAQTAAGIADGIATSEDTASVTNGPHQRPVQICVGFILRRYLAPPGSDAEFARSSAPYGGRPDECQIPSISGSIVVTAASDPNSQRVSPVLAVSQFKVPDTRRAVFETPPRPPLAGWLQAGPRETDSESKLTRLAYGRAGSCGAQV